MALYRLAVLVKKEPRASALLTDAAPLEGAVPGEDEEILLIRQEPPPPLAEEEYRRYVDSDLWDLPSAPLKAVEGDAVEEEILVEGADSCSDKLDLRRFDIHLAIDQIMSHLGLPTTNNAHWTYYKLVEEPDFGPDSAVHTLFLLGRFKVMDDNMQGPGLCRWMPVQRARRLLLEVNLNDGRMGPLVAAALSFESSVTAKWQISPIFNFQEYPLGICILPMKSRTAKPFRTTNLLIVAHAAVSEGLSCSTPIVYGDALLVDPGCCSELHTELADIVAKLPRKLMIFVTHHHFDHVDASWSSGYTKISDGDEIHIGEERFRAIFAPGHTDGHVALLHVRTNSLVVGDHCVGQGSAVLDVTSGGTMKDYFQTTYRFLEMSPHVVIPMHGRINFWPKSMLCGYLKHRRDRELSILNAIEAGARTMFEVVSKVYADVDIKLWIPASSNVRLHVDHLASQGKLPKAFSLETFSGSYDSFLSEIGTGNLTKL